MPSPRSCRGDGPRTGSSPRIAQLLGAGPPPGLAFLLAPFLRVVRIGIAATAGDVVGYPGGEAAVEPVVVDVVTAAAGDARAVHQVAAATVA